MKNELVSDFQVPLLASYSVSYQVSNTWFSQVITTFGVLPQGTVKVSWEEKKRHHSTSTAYLSRALGEERQRRRFCMQPGIFSSKVGRI